MKILRFSIKLWKFCGVYLTSSSTTLDYYLSLISIFALTSANLLFFWLSFTNYLSEKDTVDKSQLFYNFTQMFGVITALSPYISAVLVRWKIGDMIELMQQVVEKSIFPQKLNQERFLSL